MTKEKSVQMIERIKRKNTYILETFEKAIKNISVVSFNIFDTIIIQGFRNESDIIERVGESAQICGITNFSVLRLEAQLYADNATGNAKYTDIYKRVGEIVGNIDVSGIYDAEMKCRCDNLYASPLGKMMYDIARALNKKVIFLGDTRFSTDVVRTLLKSYGYADDDDVFLSVGNERDRGNAGLYAYIRDYVPLDVNGWFHVGNDKNADIDVPRSLGISAMRVDSPMAGYLAVEGENGIARIEVDEEEIIKNYSECAVFDEIPVISAKNVSMVFNMSKEKVDNLKEYVIKLIKRELQFERFTALSDVSLDIMKGERVAIIGRNGSGKSTFLKIASGVMKPTSGTMSVKGSIAPMIELGAGFDFELSARENVFLNGAILGYNRREMEKKYDEIISFAELETFQDTAIKNFSSGMITRLGFAIATCNIPDILIIDEVLSVGDYAFQKKCQKKIREMTEHGATVLFVSHSAEDIKTICDRVVWLDKGRVKADGEAEYIVDMYINEMNDK